MVSGSLCPLRCELFSKFCNNGTAVSWGTRTNIWEGVRASQESSEMGRPQKRLRRSLIQLRALENQSLLGVPPSQLGGPWIQLRGPPSKLGEPPWQLGGPWIQPGEPWNQQGGPQNQLGGPQRQLGGPQSQLGSRGGGRQTFPRFSSSLYLTSFIIV